MKVIEAIDIIDRLKPNTFTQEDKLRWLSDLDGRTVLEFLRGFCKEEHREFTSYEPEGIDRELVIPYPYETVYIQWLESRIDYYNGETDRYNNSIVQFNAEYSAFKEWYIQTHMPTSARLRINYHGGWCHHELPYPLSD